MSNRRVRRATLALCGLFVLAIGLFLREAVAAEPPQRDAGQAPEAAGIDTLFRQLQSTNVDEHFGAAVALAKLGKQVGPSVVKFLEDERWHIQLTAIWILGEIRDDGAVEPLILLVKGTKLTGPPGYSSYVGSMSYEPQKALALFDAPNKFPSWNLLLHRRAAAIALHKIGDKRAIAPLREVLQTGRISEGTEAKVAVARALKALSPDPLPTELEKELQKWYKEYR